MTVRFYVVCAKATDLFVMHDGLQIVRLTERVDFV